MDKPMIVDNATSWFEEGRIEFRKGLEFDEAGNHWEAWKKFIAAATLFEMSMNNHHDPQGKRTAHKRFIQANKCAARSQVEVDKAFA